MLQIASPAIGCRCGRAYTKTRTSVHFDDSAVVRHSGQRSRPHLYIVPLIGTRGKDLQTAGPIVEESLLVETCQLGTGQQKTVGHNTREP